MNRRKRFATALIFSGALAVPHLGMTSASADPLLSGSCTINDPQLGNPNVSVGVSRGDSSTTVSYHVDPGETSGPSLGEDCTA